MAWKIKRNSEQDYREDCFTGDYFGAKAPELSLPQL